MQDDLLHQAMTNLSGRPVRVRWQRPALAHGLAACWIDAPTKTARIDIQPYMATATTLHTLCHEAAHIRLNHAPVLGGDLVQVRPGSVKIDDDFRQSQRAHPREGQADRLAEVFVDWAQRNAYKYYLAETSMERYLLALRDLPEAEVKRMVEHAV